MSVLALHGVQDDNKTTEQIRFSSGHEPAFLTCQTSVRASTTREKDTRAEGRVTFTDTGRKTERERERARRQKVCVAAKNDKLGHLHIALKLLQLCNTIGRLLSVCMCVYNLIVHASLTHTDTHTQLSSNSPCWTVNRTAALNDISDTQQA